ncbi:TPA: GNAT family N-acetyltransferase [Bacillus cereus]|nr:GNAT family N-acetyltransferase [Bacillus cereus]
MEGIAKVGAEGWHATYSNFKEEKYIEDAIKEQFNYERISSGILMPDEDWHGFHGWYVALEDNEVVGIIAGGEIGVTAQILVFYVLPNQIGKGIGTSLLEHLTEIQQNKGFTKQLISTFKENLKGISFLKEKNFMKIKEYPINNGSQNDKSLLCKYSREI